MGLHHCSHQSSLYISCLVGFFVIATEIWSTHWLKSIHQSWRLVDKRSAQSGSFPEVFYSRINLTYCHFSFSTVFGFLFILVGLWVPNYRSIIGGEVVGFAAFQQTRWSYLCTCFMFLQSLARATELCVYASTNNVVLISLITMIGTVLTDASTSFAFQDLSAFSRYLTALKIFRMILFPALRDHSIRIMLNPYITIKRT